MAAHINDNNVSGAHVHVYIYASASSMSLVPVSHGPFRKATQSMATETPQLYQLHEVVTLLHGSIEQPLSGSGISRENCVGLRMLTFVFI